MRRNRAILGSAVLAAALGAASAGAGPERGEPASPWRWARDLLANFWAASDAGPSIDPNDLAASPTKGEAEPPVEPGDLASPPDAGDHEPLIDPND